MIELDKQLIKRLVKIFAELKIYFASGQGYVADLKYPFLLAITIRVYFPNLSIPTIIAIALFVVVALVVLGFIDLKYIKLHQKIQEIATEKYNPYFQKLKLKLSSKSKKFK